MTQYFVFPYASQRDMENRDSVPPLYGLFRGNRWSIAD